MNWIKLKLLSFLGVWLIRGLGRAVRLAVEGGEQVDWLYRNRQNMIIAFWHGQQLMMPLAYRGKNAHVLISQHRDGELVYRIIKRFGFHAVRGSTTRGGLIAFRQLLRLGQSGVDLVITPDGPKGPRHVVQPGIIRLARATGLPIVPLVFSCSKKKSFLAGIDLLYPIHLDKGFLYGETQFGFHGLQEKLMWK